MPPLRSFPLTPVLLLLLSGCGLTPTEAEERLARSLERIVERDDDVHHAVLHVSSDALGVDGTWAAGVAYAGEDVPMTAEIPFASASVGKLFTATTVLVLADRGLLSLDDTLPQWLEADLLQDLPVKGGLEALEAVTLRCLLSHRSGLPDYFSDETVDGAPNVSTLLTEAPDQHWTPERLLRYTAAHFAPAGRPGATFHYADTNYDLLGLVVEAATGQPFHEVVREVLLDPLALTHTWYYNQEEAPAAVEWPSAGVWFGAQSVAGTPALSLDWAGGGLMTTTADLALFLRSLAAGEPVALARLQEEWSLDALSGGIDYGYGLWRVQPSEVSWLLRGPEMIGVSGATGSFAYLIPQHNAVVTGTFDQSLYAEEHLVYLLTQVLPTLDRIVPAQQP